MKFNPDMFEPLTKGGYLWRFHADDMPGPYPVLLTVCVSDEWQTEYYSVDGKYSETPGNKDLVPKHSLHGKSVWLIFGVVKYSGDMRVWSYLEREQRDEALNSLTKSGAVTIIRSDVRVML